MALVLSKDQVDAPVFMPCPVYVLRQPDKYKPLENVQKTSSSEDGSSKQDTGKGKKYISMYMARVCSITGINLEQKACQSGMGSKLF